MNENKKTKTILLVSLSSIVIIAAATSFYLIKGHKEEPNYQDFSVVDAPTKGYSGSLHRNNEDTDKPEQVEDRSGIYKNTKDEGIELSDDNYYKTNKNSKAQILSVNPSKSSFSIKLEESGEILQDVQLNGVDLFTSEVDVGNDVAINKELSTQFPIEWIIDYFKMQEGVELYVEVVNNDSNPKLVKLHDNSGKDFTERLLKYGLATPSDTSNDKYLNLDQESKDTLTGFYFKPTIYNGKTSPEVK